MGEEREKIMQRLTPELSEVRAKLQNVVKNAQESEKRSKQRMAQIESRQVACESEHDKALEQLAKAEREINDLKVQRDGLVSDVEILHALLKEVERDSPQLERDPPQLEPPRSLWPM